MLHHLRNVLTADEIARLRQIAEQANFVPGQITNPHSRIKDNLQLPQNDPGSEEAGKLVRAAIFRNQTIRDIVVPKQVARPTLCLYKPGMTYGYHVDEAIFPSTPPMRSDVSCTVFISDPDDYQGGELEVESGAGVVSFKCGAGDAVVYPSTTVHRVAPVTEGRRIVAITWFQSMVRDQRQRDVLLQLQQVANILHAAGDPQGGRTITEAIRTNLLRMWAEL
jgi:PKHD-type hydroxylase